METDRNFQRMNVEDRIIRAKFSIRENYPFWYQLLFYLKMKKENNCQSMGVSKDGVCVYNEDFVMSLNKDELISVLCHEIGHVAFMHLLTKHRKKLCHNVSADVVINNMLLRQGFRLPSNIIIPHNNQYVVNTTKGSYTIKDIDKKTADSIYFEIEHLFDDNQESGKRGDGGNGGSSGYDGQFDNHEIDDDMTEQQKQIEEYRARNMISESMVIAKQQGKLPSDFESFLTDYITPKKDVWEILRNFVKPILPSHESWDRCDRRFIHKKIYLPFIKREGVEVVVHIDSSGSITENEAKLFLGKIREMLLCCDNVVITLIECDCKIHQVLKITKSKKDLLDNFRILGGGGTSHKPVFKYIDENVKNCKILISLTDGFSDINYIAKPRYAVVFMVTPNGVKQKDINWGKVVKMKEWGKK